MIKLAVDENIRFKKIDIKITAEVQLMDDLTNIFFIILAP